MTTTSIGAGRVGTADAHHWRQLLWISLGGLLALRLAALALNRTDLFFDEAQYWTWSLEPAFGYYSKPPLIAWAISLATGVCGSSEFCIRLPAPLFHTVTAVAVFALGARLYGPRTGFLSALAFATLPGISLSSSLISTDVPLLTFWALALVGFAAMIDDRAAWWPAVLLGLSLGLGLNAKYAMAYVVLCGGIYLAVTPARRWLLSDRRLWVALGLGVLLILPNLAWNATNSFATFAHTADNAKWTGSLFRPDKGLEFFLAQFGVFGPILFAVLLVAVYRWWSGALGESERMLLAFALPIVAIVTVQAFISRAHANWAAPAYVSATVLAITMLEREGDRRWLTRSFWAHGAILGLLIVAFALAGRVAIPFAGDPFARTLGWREMAEATQFRLQDARTKGAPYGSVITDERAMTAELLYYMRGESTPILAWTWGGRPNDHYEMKRPFKPGAPEPVLLVALRTDSDKPLAKFGKVEALGTEQLPAGRTTRRGVAFYKLSGFKGF